MNAVNYTACAWQLWRPNQNGRCAAGRRSIVVRGPLPAAHGFDAMDIAMAKARAYPSRHLAGVGRGAEDRRVENHDAFDCGAVARLQMDDVADVDGHCIEA